MDDAPLILTLGLDDAAFARFDGLRRAHFPPERNFIPAHLTLFHHLPSERHDEIVARLRRACAERAPLDLRAGGLQFMGRGVAYRIDGDGLTALRRELARTWWAWLTPQDRQGFRAHVTVQNKVSAERAKDLHQRLSAEFSPFRITGEALLLWRYLGGPWEPLGAYPFAVRTPAQA